MWLILKWYMILEDFFLLDSVRYRDDVMTTLKFDWSNLKILMSGWYRKLTSSCVSFTTYQQCHSDIEGDVTPISLQYQNVHWETLSALVCNSKVFAQTVICCWSERLRLPRPSYFHHIFVVFYFHRCVLNLFFCGILIFR